MASTIKCPACGGTVRTDEQNCPHCGEANPGYVKDSPRKIFQPKTIEELKEYCAERGMPLLRMRFFIGENYKEARAFGIYKAGENRYVVYKNKADGSRAVRYDGPDETYAVKELFSKLLSECHNRGIYPDGPVTRTSGGEEGYKPSFPRRHPALTVFLAVVMIVLGGLGISEISKSTRNKSIIDQAVKDLREHPSTYGSKSAADKYITYDLSSGEVVVSSSRNDHLNDGYYTETRYVYPENEQYFASERSFYADQDTAQKGAVYYRNGSYNWYVYIEAEKDWRTAHQPDFADLGTFLTYTGSEWQSSLNVPDFTASPVNTGYYQYNSDYYYRQDHENLSDWYSYQKAEEDWVASDCPLKSGMPAEELTYLGRYYSYVKNPNIQSFDNSTPYAIRNNKTGYYRTDDTFYYHYSISTPRKGYKYLFTYTYHWCAYGQKPDSSGTPESEKTDGEQKEWYRLSAEPDLASVRYLGSEYKSGWQKEWDVSDFKESAVGMSVYSVSGYVKQQDQLYYHYKTNWYTYDSDDNDWVRSGSPEDDGVGEVYLGDSYQTAVDAEWEEDWTSTDFKSSSTWHQIETAERIEAEKAAREAEQRQKELEQKNKSYSYDYSSSDYDSWDSSDTDWDSDW